MGDFDDEANLIRQYETHVEAVRADVPASRLLVFDVRDGWEPLCAFLDVPVPGKAFPRRNDQASLNASLDLDGKELLTELAGDRPSRRTRT